MPHPEVQSQCKRDGLTVVNLGTLIATPTLNTLLRDKK